jgi:hypothetical protein
MSLGYQSAACKFCKKGIGDEFHFTCLACGANYCYIHMSRHGHDGLRRERAQEVAVVKPAVRR